MLESLNILDLAIHLNIPLKGNQEGKQINHFVLDSRKKANPQEALFVCLKGERHNAHDYISELYKEGYRSFLIDEEVSIDSFPDASFLQTDNSLLAFQNIAKLHRDQFDMPIVGVTGSFGKTIIKEWLFQLLQSDFHIVRSPKSYNSQVGLPLSVLQIKPYHNLGIFEAGISKRKEMARLSDVLKCDVGILSNIGSAHQENFDSFGEILDEKLNLFNHASSIIYSSEVKEYNEAIQSKFSDKQLLSWGQRANDYLKIISQEKEKEKTIVTVQYLGETSPLVIPFIDKYSIENALHCVVFLLHLDYPLEIISKRLAELKPIALRLQMKHGINDSLIIHDPYLKDEESLNISVDFLKQQKGYSKYILIQDAEETLKTSDLSKKLDQIITIGGSSKEGIHFNSVSEFIDKHNKDQFNNAAILINGSFNHQLEIINQALQEKAHQTVMEINIKHLVDNLNYFKSKLKPSTKVMAMVKAFSYGSGSDEIASILQYQKVDSLGVAYADEGLALRKAGITLPILVMNAEPSAFEMMIKNHLSPVIFNLKGLKSFNQALDMNSDTKHFPIHIELETGMHRLGFNQKDLNEAKNVLIDQNQIKVQSIFSHLSASDDENKNEFTLNQISTFKSMSDDFRGAFDYSIDQHILNTNGILRFPEYQMDMVRLGIGLYGICYKKSDQRNLTEVSSLKTSISQIKWVKSESNIGYGGNNIGSSDLKIAILPIGYADGFRRSLSDGKGIVYINNQAASVIGKVCMDMTMVDVTEINCTEGDEVIIFDQNHSIKEFSRQMDTIPYEALTSISPRVKRVYFQE